MDSALNKTFWSILVISFIYEIFFSEKRMNANKLKGPGGNPVGRGMKGRGRINEIELSKEELGALEEEIENEISEELYGLFGNVNGSSKRKRKDLKYTGDTNQPPDYFDPMSQVYMSSRFGNQNPVYDIKTFKSRNDMTDQFQVITNTQEYNNFSGVPKSLPQEKYKETTPDYYTVDDNKKYYPRHSEVVPYDEEDSLYSQLF